MKLNVQSLLALMLSCCLLSAGPAPVIGVAKANGSFRLDSSLIRGNGSLFEGSEIGRAHV
mgnify:CR=1 FL=1